MDGRYFQFHLHWYYRYLVIGFHRLVSSIRCNVEKTSVWVIYNDHTENTADSPFRKVILSFRLVENIQRFCVHVEWKDPLLTSGLPALLLSLPSFLPSSFFFYCKYISTFITKPMPNFQDLCLLYFRYLFLTNDFPPVTYFKRMIPIQ